MGSALWCSRVTPTVPILNSCVLWPRCWIAAIHFGDLNGIPGSWLQSGLVVTIEGICQVNQQMEHFPAPSLSLFLVDENQLSILKYLIQSVFMKRVRSLICFWTLLNDCYMEVGKQQHRTTRQTQLFVFQVFPSGCWMIFRETFLSHTDIHYWMIGEQRIINNIGG